MSIPKKYNVKNSLHGLKSQTWDRDDRIINLSSTISASFPSLHLSDGLRFTIRYSWLTMELKSLCHVEKNKQHQPVVELLDSLNKYLVFSSNQKTILSLI